MGEGASGGDPLPLNPAEWERRACGILRSATFHYVAGGAGDEWTIAENLAALERLRLVPRVLRAGAEVSTTTRLLGFEVPAPIMVAPFAYQGALHAEGELASARAAASLGLVMCVSTLANRSAEQVADAAGPGPRWFQLYPLADMGANHELVARAGELGYEAIVVTVDLPPYGFRERELTDPFVLAEDLDLPHLPRTDEGPPPTPREAAGLLRWDLTWDDVGEIAAASPLPVVVKGVLSPADAALAADHGASGVVVSNHGGRQLDGSVASIDALPAIAAAVGERLEVYVDGGIRRGVDVLRALALGARAVLVGRPEAWGLAVAGEDGVRHVLGQLVAETANAMHLAGCAEVGDVGEDLIFRVENG